MTVILSYIQTRPLQEAWRRGQTVVETSPDLGISSTSVTLSAEGVGFATGECVDWASVEKISKSEVTCYSVSANEVQPVQIFSQETNRLYSLMPTQAAPSILIAGFVMHRFKEIDPWQHAQRMVAAIAPMRGQDTRKGNVPTIHAKQAAVYSRDIPLAGVLAAQNAGEKPLNGSVLDTTTGLGYTAILAARTTEHVTTIEVDASVQAIAQRNPWSKELFDNPRITQVMGDASEVVPTFGDESFDRVMHDPPALKLAGELYSGAFYRELYRILKRGGRLFHYIGDPGSKSGGTVTHGVVRRLQEAGFSRIVRHAEAYGVVAYK